MRLAIFGGTFDPVHNAHLAVAREAAERFGLNRVLFVPASHPPWKDSGTSYDDRFNMVKLACAVDDRFEASRLEEKAGKSYTIETLERAQGLFPDARLFFIIGTDAFHDVEKWHRAQDLLKLVDFIVVTRPGHEFTAPSGARVQRLDKLALDVSSSQIRRALAAGAACEDIPDSVADYIREHGLYRSGD